MIDISTIDYSALDRREILMCIFHPRQEGSKLHHGITAVKDILIPVEINVVVGCRFHFKDTSVANILFFHGNGEIAGDYDDLGPLFNQIGINFMPVDYRGYGRSTGKPTVTSMMRDCHIIFEFVMNWLKESDYSGPLIIMGRSLGSASALELANHYKSRIDGLIIESGFAYSTPLLELLGINITAMGLKEEEGFRNVDKIKDFDKPALIIHAERDHIIPFSDGQALYNACPSSEKKLLCIPGANHNDIFYYGMSEYMTSVKKLVHTIREQGKIFQL